MDLFYYNLFCAFAIRIYVFYHFPTKHAGPLICNASCRRGKGGGKASEQATNSDDGGRFLLSRTPSLTPSTGSSATAGRLLVSFEMALRPSSVELHSSSVLLAGFYCVSANLITAALTVVAAQIIGAIVH